MAERTSRRHVKQLSVVKRRRLCFPHTLRKRKLRCDVCFHYLNGYLKLRHLLGRRLIVEELVKETHPMGKGTGELRHRRSQGGCQQDLGRCRMDHREASAQRYDGCWILPPCYEKELLASNRIRAGPESPFVGIARSHPIPQDSFGM